MNHTRARRAQIVNVALLALGLAYPFAVEASGHGYLVSTGSRMLIFALAAMSLDVLVGYGGMVSLGHAAFFGIGAYSVGILSFHAFEGSLLWGLPGSESALVSVPLAIVVAGVAALVVGALSLRTSGIFFIMITLAFGQMFYFIGVSLEPYGGDDGLFLYGGANRLLGLSLADDLTLYFVCLVCLAAFYLLCRTLVASRFGTALVGIRQNEARMRTLGYDTSRYKLAAFAFGGAGAGLAGALLTNHAAFVSPDLLHWTRSGEFLFMVVLGGMGSLTGAILGAAAYLSLEEFLPVIFDALDLPTLKTHWRIVFGPLLIAIMLFSRGGIYGALVRRGGPSGG